MIYSIVLPGRFPTTFYAYPEFTLLNREIQDEVRFANLNLLFWEYIFSTDFLEFLRRHFGPAVAPQIEFLSNIIGTGIINTLRDQKSFYDPEQYLDAIFHLGEYLSRASGLLRQLSGGTLQGLSIYGLSYEMQHSLKKVMAYAASDRNPIMDFYRTHADFVRGIFDAEIVSAVTYSYTDILHLGVLSHLYRQPGTTVLIHGHSWENNAVDYLLEHSNQYVDFLRHIDGVVVREDVLVETFNQLAETGKTAQLKNLHLFSGKATYTGVTDDYQRNDLNDLDFERLHQEADRQQPLLFAPELVTLHRLSSRGCYWSRCEFCRHNSRHPDRSNDVCDESGNISKWTASLRQLSEISRVIVFCDQGIDPEAAASLAAMAADASIVVRWSLRTRIDPRWDASRIATVAQGGCTEMIFGLESIQDATLQRMNKTSLKGEAYRSLATQIHRDSVSCGIYNHYCMIYGYPCETFEECQQTLDFLASLIHDAPKTTFSLNRFRLLFKSDIYNFPESYGIGTMIKPASLSNMFRYDEPNSWRSIELVEKGLMGFYQAIGYREDILTNQILMETIPAFINDSGHTPLLKIGHSRNPFISKRDNL